MPRLPASPSGTEFRKPSKWPPLHGGLEGSNQIRFDNQEIRFDNQESIAVLVGVRNQGRGGDATVQPNSVHSMWVPDGRYSVYFHYLDGRDVVSTGREITLRRQNVTLQLRRQAAGNYPLRRLR